MPQLLRHRGGSVWPYLAFLTLFTILLIAITKLYLLAALADYNKGDTASHKIIGAQALLMMTLVLVILLLSMVLLFRFGKFFLPRPTNPPSKTQYTDAWTESGKRMQPPKDEQE